MPALLTQTVDWDCISGIAPLHWRFSRFSGCMKHEACF